jgi:hypothetical protein
MDNIINQAVVFTKPVHHLGLPLSPEQLEQETRTFLEENGFKAVYNRHVTGPELAGRDVIKEHYLMYSQASSIAHPEELGVSDEAKARFEAAFGKSWQEEVDAGRIMGNPRLMKEKGLSPHELYLLWNAEFAAQQTEKIQDGLIMAWLDEQECYCINAFYPALEENFYHPEAEIAYYVFEFNPEQVSWEQFRKNILGATDASKADPESFRGELYACYARTLEFPGRDNFVHGSAGPLEGFIERTIHEPDFDMSSNPVGRYLAGRGVSLEQFNEWKSNQSIAELGELFDATEEKNTAETFKILDTIRF